MIVADANIIAYLVVPGPFSDGAADVLQTDGLWLSPAIWQDEVLNALTQHVRKKDITIEEAVEGFSAVSGVVRTIQREYDIRGLIEMTVASGCALYDCEYVQAARMAGAKLVTEDQKVLRTFPDTALSIQVFLDSVGKV